MKEKLSNIKDLLVLICWEKLQKQWNKNGWEGIKEPLEENFLWKAVVLRRAVWVGDKMNEKYQH